MRLRDDPSACIRPCVYGPLEGEAMAKYGPSLTLDRVYFTCPVHGGHCLIGVAFTRGAPFEFKVKLSDKRTTKVWQATGEFPDSFTLTPSIHVHDTLASVEGGESKTHYHGHLSNGEAK